MLTIQYVVDVPVITPDDCTPVDYTFENLVFVNANVLVLAGTVGDPYTPMYASFLQWCANRILQVLVVSNGKVSTEYMEKLINRVNKNSCHGMVYYLHNTTIKISNVVFGCFDDETLLSAKIHEAKIDSAYMYGDDTRYVVVTRHGLSQDMVNSVDYVIGGVKSASYNKHDALITVPTCVPVWMK
jgi:hypothetical protein